MLHYSTPGESYAIHCAVNRKQLKSFLVWFHPESAQCPTLQDRENQGGVLFIYYNTLKQDWVEINSCMPLNNDSMPKVLKPNLWRLRTIEYSLTSTS